MGVITFVHKELLPCLEPIPLKALGLGEEQVKLCTGRVMVTAAQKETKGREGQTVSKMQYFINTYQHTADHPYKQQRLLQAI
eukprot:685465-Rhodomonas_salina.1